MAVIKGLEASFRHSQNGMIRSDMQACTRVANKLGEVIIFRSTGPWAKRWIERGYPTKNFHVKGKSSDWGPQAGFVPYLGKYSKVWFNQQKADKGTQANDKGIKGGYAKKQTLVLTDSEINDQLNRPEEHPARKAIKSKTQVQGSKDLILICEPSGGGKEFAFKAIHRSQSNDYEIWYYPEGAGTNFFKLVDAQVGGPLEVMCSGEKGGEKPMTGDYDLMAICPSWGQYGSLTSTSIHKPGLWFGNKQQPGLSYGPGVGMDNVLDPRLHTGGKFDHKDYQGSRYSEQAKLNLQQESGKYDPREEHEDMGNLTPRILRCINELNAEMGALGSKAPMRRVHHNAESHRHKGFGAITESEMNQILSNGFGDGFPLTVFQPSALVRPTSGQVLPTATYTEVCTLETYAEFKQYAVALKGAGYFVPKSWVWGLPSQIR
ncbi:MAG: CyaA/EF/ExoY family adenylyl cyclase toxin [Pseudomonadales bacterium]|uniref:Bifunctional hemolysin-adenylate cyclase n=1 Tax=Oleiphilus messinensis TaxID=141451 RepID=A0A1Y0IF50_9GAMM|nr:anthrax toxin-like adenylyl cyclase domain-containing protein [Oleiphilus messinensis]ARU59162.1 bifunctional hemolysin-adenylate cyclase precursor [Oleiphilus messinensis]MCG8614080.1 CyaA/EF/ExoY family adenylyl cyclase toxin [Pseudomonadales bacterium]